MVLFDFNFEYFLLEQVQNLQNSVNVTWPIKRICHCQQHTRKKKLLKLTNNEKHNFHIPKNTRKNKLGWNL